MPDFLGAWCQQLMSERFQPFDRIHKPVIFDNKLHKMSTAELNQKKLELIDWINRLADEHMIDLLDSLKSGKVDEDWWDELSSSQQQLVKDGLEDIANGNVVSSEQFWNKLKIG